MDNYEAMDGLTLKAVIARQFNVMYPNEMIISPVTEDDYIQLSTMGLYGQGGLSKRLVEMYPGNFGIQQGRTLFARMESGEGGHDLNEIFNTYASSGVVTDPYCSLLLAWTLARTIRGHEAAGWYEEQMQLCSNLIVSAGSSLTGLGAVLTFVTLLLYMDYEGFQAIAQSTVLDHHIDKADGSMADLLFNG